MSGVVHTSTLLTPPLALLSHLPVCLMQVQCDDGQLLGDGPGQEGYLPSVEEDI